MNKPIIETNGKVQESPTQFTLLEQVWSQQDTSKYGTLDVLKYTEQLDDMTRSDLEAHARQMNVGIVENTLRLKAKLLDEFNSYVALSHKPVNPLKPTPTNKEAMKILSEGR